MDFHSLARRDLQALCKKNKIPANLTNLAMADALQSLKSIEWDDEIRQKFMPQSDATEQHGSPLPRSRRVAAISSDISLLEVITDKEDEMKKEASIEANQTPATAVRRSQRIQSAMSTRTCARTSAAAGTGTSAAGTRTRKGNKEEAPESVMVVTPAPQRGRKKATETPAQVPVARSSARPTRQSTRRLAESTKGTRVTRTMANMMALDADDDKEAHTEVLVGETPSDLTLDVEGKEDSISDVAPEQEQETRTDVIELGEATEPNSTDKLEAEEVADQNQVNDVLEVTEQATEQTADNVHLMKEGELVSDEKLNLVEHSMEEIVVESTEENIEEGSDINAAIPISEEDEIPQKRSNTDTDESEGSTQEEFNSKMSDKKVGSLLCDELKDDVSIEKSVEEVAEVGSDTNVVPISEERQVHPEEEESTLADAPIMGFVSEVVPENNSDLQDAPSGLCFSSPVRAPADVGVEKMLDSVVRHFAKASLQEIDGTDKIVSDDAPELGQNENADKEKVDLNSMSLRKLKALYKDRLMELNSKKVGEGGKRLPLGKLDENLLV